ncbi:MAG TPA: LamG-like jellyroll fold domain-containing protein [Pyrinomonadaceae bacterium]|nr:LamG-like jellyroll fold domain-containing protein [Pyrinomonadaceae bacterium]
MFRLHAQLLTLVCVIVLIVVLVPETSTSQGTKHSLSLNGTSSYMSVPYGAALDISGPITVEAWIKLNSVNGNYQDIVCREVWGQAGSGGGYEFAITSTGKLRLDLYQSHNQYTTAIGSTTVTTNVWHHVAGVFDGSQMRVYLDGQLDGSLSTTNGPASGTSALNIGKSTYGTYYFGGLIDEVRISAAALYSSNFTPGLGPASNTRALWRFDGQTTNDTSGNGNHGTLQSGAAYSTDVPTTSNNAPTVTITDPLSNTTFTAGSTIVIDASAADSDGIVSKVDFYQGTTLLGTDTSSPYTFAWNNVPAGSYSLTTKATDDSGAVSTSSAITVIVPGASGLHSLSLNGTSSYMSVPNSSTINISGPITVEAWIKLNSVNGNYQDIVCREAWGQAGTGGGYELAITNTGKLRLDLYQSHNQYTTAIGSTTVTTNTWHHVAGVFDGSQMRVYLDGVLDGSLSTTNGPASGTSPLNIGKSTYTSYYFGGLIDEVRLSAAALYSTNFTPGPSIGFNIRALWRFDGQTTNDFSGNDNHGTLQGNAGYSSDVPSTGGGSQRPVPVAGGPYTGPLGQAINFSSSGSSDPDGAISSYHWNFGDGTSANSANPSRTYQTSGLFTATLTVTDNAGLRASATAVVTITGPTEARLDTRNQTGGGGENPLSQNFNWSLPLVSLSGRAGMNLGLMLSYNSLVWTKNSSANYVAFDEDRGFPSPGFRLGFPVIQPRYHNSEVGKYAFLLIGSDGSRTELRQVADSPLYEAADSSHLLLDTTTMTVRTSDGTQLSYVWMNSEYNCTQIKDRNGNYITINYTPFGRIDNVVDTLERNIKFTYEGGLLKSITQDWNKGLATHNWAVFTYGTTPIQTNFGGLAVYGVPNNLELKTLSKVTLADGSHIDFSYTSWGQVWKISSFAPNDDLLNYRAYNLPGSALLTSSQQNDCPRFTQRRDWAKFWNGDTNGDPGGTPSTEDAVTSFAEPVGDSWTMPDANQTPAIGKRAEVTSPDGTVNKIYFEGIAGDSTAWRRGLPALVVTYSGGAWQRKVMTTWTQDNTSVFYPLNPRVLETNVYDPSGNHARTRIVYQHHNLPNGTSCELPKDVFEYAADGTTVLRSTSTTYKMTSDYTNKHILGLVSVKSLYEGEVDNQGTLMSKVAFFYDEGSIDGDDAPVQHDSTNYGSTFVLGRGNLTSVKRYDVTETNVFTTTSSKYNRAGSVISSTDAADHTVTISYADSFSDGVTRITLAYPTKVTDPDEYFSTSKYNFDFGGVTLRQTPRPNTTEPDDEDPRPEQSWTFDSIGRLQQVTNLVNDAYTRFEYSGNGIKVDVYATIQEGLGEAHSFKYTDGAGRVIASATDHNTDTFSGQKVVYDVMGRVIKTSNPTETTASGQPSQWNTTGDDANTGWVFTEQTYDWKGRPLVTTNPSMTSTPSETTTKQFSYSGCGCAGGQVVTITDEGTIQANSSVKKRQQKIYSDVLGRTIKTEIMDWDGTGPNGIGRAVYSATTFTYNARDQVTLARQFAGPTSSSTFQDTTATYDGFGRLKTQHLPEQQADTSYPVSTDHTTWNYNNDDSIQSVVDARGVVTSFTYNNRGLPTLIEFDSSDIPAGKNVASTTAIAFAYDARGNRTSMSDGSGTVSYHYNQLSQMDWEERSFAGLPNAGAFRLNYEYNLAGILKKVTDQRSGTSFTETLDKLGRVTSVDAVGFSGAQTQFISQAQYRAWGALKSRTQANATLSLTYNQRLLPETYSYAGAETSYQYHNDGSIKFADDQSGSAGIKDRAYSYDLAGRLEHAYSGVEARNFVDNTTGGTPDGPFDHQYAYDHWGNMLGNSGRFWSRTVNTSDSYGVNNRVAGWSYDAEGNVLSRNEPATTTSPFVPAKYTYDAAGRQVGSTQTRSYIIEIGRETTAFVNSQTFDGDNQMTHYALGRNISYGNPQLPPGSETTEAYLLRSTVLGGSLISEYKGDGTWSKSHVYAGGERLGQQTTAETGTAESIVETLDPITGDGAKHLSNGTGMGQTTMNPGGVDVGSEDPFPPDGSGDPDGLSDGGLGRGVSALIPIEGFGAKCELDGLQIDCSRISGNSSVQCPNNDCGTRTITLTARSGGHVVDTSTFLAPEGWDGSLDGTFGVNSEWAKRVFARWEGGGQIFVGQLMSRGPDDELITQKGAVVSKSEFVLFGFGFRGVFLMGLLPQTQTQQTTDTRTSCQRFADEVQHIQTHNPHLTATDFVERLYSRFANNRNEFSSDGFKGPFQDFSGSPDQARHYVGGLQAGFIATQWGSETVGRWIANSREYEYVVTMDTSIPLVYPVQTESHKADQRLNAVSTRHGGALSRGEIRPIQLSDRIRREVCQ